MRFYLESAKKQIVIKQELNLCMYIINTIHHGKSVRMVFTHLLYTQQNIAFLIGQ